MRSRGGGHGSFLDSSRSLLSGLLLGDTFPDPTAKAAPHADPLPCSILLYMRLSVCLLIPPRGAQALRATFVCLAHLRKFMVWTPAVCDNCTIPAWYAGNMVPHSHSRVKGPKERLEGIYKFQNDQLPRSLNPQDMKQCLAHSRCSVNSHTTNKETHQRLGGTPPPPGLHPTQLQTGKPGIWDENTVITFPEMLLEALSDGASG